MPVFLPLLDNDVQDDLVQALSRIGPIILSSKSLHNITTPEHSSYHILVDQDSLLNHENVVTWLEGGAEKVIVPLLSAKELIGVIPAQRLMLLLDVGNVSAVS